MKRYRFTTIIALAALCFFMTACSEQKPGNDPGRHQERGKGPGKYHLGLYQGAENPVSGKNPGEDGTIQSETCGTRSRTGYDE